MAEFYSKYFSDCLTVQQVKDAFRRLAREWHPDLNPDKPNALQTMQEINSDYDRVCDILTQTERPDKRDSAYGWHRDTNVAVRDAIIEALKMTRGHKTATIEVTGFWIWIWGTEHPRTSPEAQAFVDALKAVGYKWSPNKNAWYLALAKSRNRSGPWDMDAIRFKYGSAEYRPDADTDTEARSNTRSEARSPAALK